MNNNPKNKKADRQSLYVTVVVILMMVAVVVAIATSLSRNTAVAPSADNSIEASDTDTSKKGKDTEKLVSDDTEDVFWNGNDENGEDESSKTDGSGDDSKNKTEKTDKSDSENVAAGSESILPVFVAPVRGEILKGCSLLTPVFSTTMEDYRAHMGVDLYCDDGGDIACVADGVIKEIWDDAMMGTCISVEHSGGAVSVYKNLYEEIPDGIEAGAKVRRGQIIATAGDTALVEIAEESHLHFELTVNGEAVDPCEYIEFASAPAFEE